MATMQHKIFCIREFIKTEEAPRSPDLTPCDFFLWGFVKEAVYVPSLPTALDDLRNRIKTAVNSVTQDILRRV